MGLLERAGLGRHGRPGRHPVEILVAARETAEIKAELLLGFGTRVVDALEICDDLDLSSEEKVDAIRETLSGVRS